MDAPVCSGRADENARGLAGPQVLGVLVASVQSTSSSRYPATALLADIEPLKAALGEIGIVLRGSVTKSRTGYLDVGPLINIL